MVDPEDIYTAVSGLPPPVNSLQINQVRFEIYLAKDIYNSAWNGQCLHSLVLKARESYGRYGNVPLIDEYDLKSAVYLVRAIYPEKTADREYWVEEWLSLRFVPGNGEPGGIDVLNLYWYEEKPMAYWIEKFIQPKGWSFHNLISGSRLCGISSFIQNPADQNEFGKTRRSDHKYTPVCFALLHKQFFDDCRREGLDFQYFIVATSDRLLKGFMRLESGNRKYGPACVRAEKTLGVPCCMGKIKLRRNDFIYQYPLYFLNQNQIVKLLKRLLVTKVISNETLKNYFGSGISAQELIEGKRIRIEKLRNLGALLGEKGKIKGASITGIQLRVMLDKVADDSRLRMTPIRSLEASVDKMIQIAFKIY